MEYRKIPPRKKNGIVARLKSTIDKYGFEETRAAINHFFKTTREKTKAQLKIEQLKKEIKLLSKNK
jgi:N-methylhydantoinase B/oxoprolinase/acetone carboxylase alpha subunit